MKKKTHYEAALVKEYGNEKGNRLFVRYRYMLNKGYRNNIVTIHRPSSVSFRIKQVITGA